MKMHKLLSLIVLLLNYSVYSLNPNVYLINGMDYKITYPFKNNTSVIYYCLDSISINENVNFSKTITESIHFNTFRLANVLNVNFEYVEYKDRLCNLKFYSDETRNSHATFLGDGTCKINIGQVRRLKYLFNDSDVDDRKELLEHYQTLEYKHMLKEYYSVVLHEMCHCLGILENKNLLSNGIMSPQNFWSLSIGSGEYNILRALYGTNYRYRSGDGFRYSESIRDSVSDSESFSDRESDSNSDSASMSNSVENKDKIYTFTNIDVINDLYQIDYMDSISVDNSTLYLCFIDLYNPRKCHLFFV